MAIRPIFIDHTIAELFLWLKVIATTSLQDKGIITEIECRLNKSSFKETMTMWFLFRDFLNKQQTSILPFLSTSCRVRVQDCVSRLKYDRKDKQH